MLYSLIKHKRVFYCYLFTSELMTSYYNIAQGYLYGQTSTEKKKIRHVHFGLGVITIS